MDIPCWILDIQVAALGRLIKLGGCMNRSIVATLVLGGGILSGCMFQTKHEIEVKPMHITIDVNVKIQEELKEKFKKTDEVSKEISDKEAEDALNRYLESQKIN